MGASFHVLPCSIEDCTVEASIENRGTCMGLNKMDQHISHGVAGNCIIHINEQSQIQIIIKTFHRFDGVQSIRNSESQVLVCNKSKL